MPCKTLNPSEIQPPLARYSHGVAIPPGAPIVRTSGQLGMAMDGSIPDGMDAQLSIILANIRAILAEAGMTPLDICHMTAWLTDRSDLPGYMSARDAFLAGQSTPAASTLLLVSGFSRPEFKVEVEVMACGDGGKA